MLELEDGEPNDPAVIDCRPELDRRREVLNRSRAGVRILAIDTEIDDELVERGFNAVFTVEPDVT